MNDEERPQPSAAQVAYGTVIYWLCIAASVVCAVGPVVAVIRPENNVLNPHFLFYTIWRGAKPAEVWGKVGGGFPGGHFWLEHPFKGDGMTQFGLALGCCCAAFALVAAAAVYLRQKPRQYGWALASVLAAMMIVLSLLGIFQMK